MAKIHGLLARFIFQSGHFRPSDLRLRSAPFQPNPKGELSVTCHLSLSDEEIWKAARHVSKVTRQTLHGRADFQASVPVAEKLVIQPAGTANNPNHANLIGWPTDKQAKLAIAQKLALAADRMKIPPANTTTSR